ncbi:hypothetical protein L9F63_003661 [Diploptera punctata]|uniref:Pseudouridylate synthase RPUSD2 n=1 Tax=Diploptera punctata TaxID=6984 RepID=A0AAD7ZKF0_DIPPU|nr:hypothetical protein L9F63_003661 [Diploptera punctata]
MENSKRKIVSSLSIAKKQKTDDANIFGSDSDFINQNTEEELRQKIENTSKADTKRTSKKNRENKTVKPRRPGFSDECYNETSYYFENGLRKVYPYFFTFTTYTKGRWVGEKLLDVFSREFRAHSSAEYERCIKTGTLTVNHEKVETDHILKHNDLLSNVVHRHEVPVSAEAITIVYKDDDILVINKPPSIPVHPCGRYRHNTIVFILAKEYNLKGLRTIHRLDRLTSGLLLFGRTQQRAMLKEYVCRVEGEFPDGEIICEEPIEVVSYKIGVCKVSPKGKNCSTIFQKLGFNGKTSVVSCKPHTGRMHQIRVHLQYLGFPIINDPLYNHSVFGPEKGKGGNIGKSDEDLIKELMIVHNAESWLGTEGDSEFNVLKPLTEEKSNETKLSQEKTEDSDKNKESEANNENNSKSDHTKEIIPSEELVKQDGDTIETANESHNISEMSFNADKLTRDDNCYECKVQFRDPKPSDLVMYLHALKYQGPDWSYQTELPDWARVDWREESR